MKGKYTIVVKLKHFSLDIKYEIDDLKVLRVIEIICFIAKSSEVLLVKEIETEPFAPQLGKTERKVCCNCRQIAEELEGHVGL